MSCFRISVHVLGVERFLIRFFNSTMVMFYLLLLLLIMMYAIISVCFLSAICMSSSPAQNSTHEEISLRVH